MRFVRDMDGVGPLPISVAAAKDFLHISATNTDDDATIALIVDGVAEAAERYTGRSLRATTWTAYYDFISNSFEIRRAPINTIDSVKYWNNADTPVLTTIDSSVYELNRSKMYPILIRAKDQDWPTDEDTRSDLVEITFTTEADRRIDEIKLAMMKDIADRYENRGDDELAMDVKRNSKFYSAVVRPRVSNWSC